MFIFNENEDYLFDQTIYREKSEINLMLILCLAHGQWKEDVGFPRYCGLVGYCRNTDANLFDINGLPIKKIFRRDIFNDMAAANDVHLSAAGATHIFADFVKHFESTRYYNEYKF